MAYQDSDFDRFDKRDYDADQSYDRRNARYSTDGGSWRDNTPNDYYLRRQEDSKRSSDSNRPNQGHWTGPDESPRSLTAGEGMAAREASTEEFRDRGGYGQFRDRGRVDDRRELGNSAWGSGPEGNGVNGNYYNEANRRAYSRGYDYERILGDGDLRGSYSAEPPQQSARSNQVYPRNYPRDSRGDYPRNRYDERGGENTWGNWDARGGASQDANPRHDFPGQHSYFPNRFDGLSYDYEAHPQYFDRDRSMPGVHSGKGPKNYRRSDDRIREDVNERLTRDGHLDASNIEVSVEEGVVTLSGTVDEKHDKRRAEDLADGVTGVIEVVNHIRLSRNVTRTTTESTTRYS